MLTRGYLYSTFFSFYFSIFSLLAAFLHRLSTSYVGKTSLLSCSSEHANALQSDSLMIAVVAWSGAVWSVPPCRSIEKWIIFLEGDYLIVSRFFWNRCLVCFQYRKKIKNVKNNPTIITSGLARWSELRLWKKNCSLKNHSVLREKMGQILQFSPSFSFLQCDQPIDCLLEEHLLSFAVYFWSYWNFPSILACSSA